MFTTSDQGELDPDGPVMGEELPDRYSALEWNGREYASRTGRSEEECRNANLELDAMGLGVNSGMLLEWKTAPASSPLDASTGKMMIPEPWGRPSPLQREIAT